MENGIARFLDTELLSKMQGTWQKVVAGTATGILIKRSENILSSLKNNEIVKMMGIISEDGMIDIDILREELKKNVPDSGVQIDLPMIGRITIKKEDVDKLYACIVNA
jgi:hypothetical protein